MSQTFSDIFHLFHTRAVPLFHTFLFNDSFTADIPGSRLGYTQVWVGGCLWCGFADQKWLNLYNNIKVFNLKVSLVFFSFEISGKFYEIFKKETPNFVNRIM